MKNIYVLSGPPASGKSSFIKENDLENYVISYDQLRLMLSAPTHKLSDNYKTIDVTIPASSSPKAFEIANTMVEYRMRNSETIILDGTHLNKDHLNNLKKASDQYNYKFNLVKFGYDLNSEELIERDNQRGLSKVGPKVINSFIKKKDALINSGIKKFNPITPEKMIKSLDWMVRDITDSYDKIKVIGDIQSCGTSFEAALNNFDDKTLYVLIGDSFDRGVEHKKVMDNLMLLLEKPNVVFLIGNHETHIQNYVTGNKISGPDFARDTLPEIMRAGYSKDDFSKIIRKSQPMYVCDFNGNRLYFSHSGFLPQQIENGVIDRAVLNPEDLYSKGLGSYSIDLDTMFDSKFLGTNIYQFHGHRNTHLHPVIRSSSQRSFNLEQKVEQGGFLAVVDIHKVNNDQILVTDSSVKNDVYSDKYSRYDEFSEKYDFHNMIYNKYVAVKELGSGIKVLNFTSDAFFKKAWDFETIQARGLFIDNANHIVARGYKKFFNLNELPETQLDIIASQFISDGKVNKIEKYNGYLGISSFIDKLGGIKVYSKGAGEEFSEKAEEIMIETLARNGFTIKDLESFIKKDYESGNRYSLTLEVIEPDWDPHMVNYDHPEVILLDVIKNTLVESLDYEKRDEIAKKFGFKTPKKEVLDFEGLTQKEAEDKISELFKEKDIEGFILQSKSTRVKIKTDWYASRKQVRNQLNKALSYQNEAAFTNILTNILEHGNHGPHIFKETLSVLNIFLEKVKENGFKDIVFSDKSINFPKTELQDSYKEVKEIYDNM